PFAPPALARTSVTLRRSSARPGSKGLLSIPYGIPLAGSNADYIKKSVEGVRGLVKRKQTTPLPVIESFNRIPKRRSWDEANVRAKIALEPAWISFPGLTKHPADGFLNQILAVRMEARRDAVRQIERRAAANGGNQSDG